VVIMASHLVLLPILLPLTGAVAGLLLWRAPRLRGPWALGAMLAATASSVVLLVRVWQTGRPMVFQLGGWAAPFGILLIGDLLGATLVVMSQAVLCGGLIYALGSRDKCVRYPAFYPLFLTLATGLSGAFLTGDLFNLFVFAELMVTSGAVLTAVSDDRYGAEAAYKYFHISLFAAVFLLSAVGCMYVSYGTLNLADLALRIAADPGQPLLPIAGVLLFAFFMVKSAVVPFHFWQPDFHAAAPTPVSAMLSSVVVKLGIYGFLRMTTLLFAGQASVYQALLIVLGAAGVIFGGLAAIGTHNAKRMLAYSTIGQLGFILVAVGWGTAPALAAAVVLVVNHSLAKAAMLMLAGSMASRAAVKSAAFEHLTGLGRAVPLAGGLFFVGGLALAGIPPANGFVGKVALFQSGLLSEDYVSLAVIGVASALTVVYIVRAFMRIWWQPAPEGVKAKPTGDRLLAPALLIGLCLLLGLWAEPLLRLANDIAASLATQAYYIGAVFGG
jgi:multicomponent Na+:H+ antiporter subunit D